MKKMLYLTGSVRLWLVCILITLTGAAYPQDIVNGLPGENQGYLILNDKGNDISEWKISIYKIAKDSLDNHDTIPVDTLMIPKNYVRLDPSYWSTAHTEPMEKHFITVTGINSNGPNLESGPLKVTNGPWGGYYVCGKSCVGPTYAWTLLYADLNLANSGDQVYLHPYMIQDEEFGITAKTYQYMGETEYNNIWTAQYWTSYYQLTNEIYHIQQGDILIYSGVTSSDNYKDRDGLLLTGIVYAVRKTMGPWRGHEISHSYGLGYGTWCSQSLSYNMNMMNSNFQFYTLSEPPFGTPVPNLECAGYAEFNTPDFPEGGGTFIDCMSGVIDPYDSETDIHSFDSYLASANDCMDEANIGDFLDDPGITVNYDDKWPASVNRMFLIRVSDPTSTPIELIYDDMLDGNGDFKLKIFHTPKGLYKVLLVGENHQIFPLFVEVTDDVTNGYQMKNELEVSVSPNPATVATFSTTVTSAVDMVVDYEVYDANNVLRYTDQFSLTEGIPYTKLVDLAFVSRFPDGVIVHRFICPDATVKTFTSLKISN